MVCAAYIFLLFAYSYLLYICNTTGIDVRELPLDVAGKSVDLEIGEILFPLFLYMVSVIRSLAHGR